MVSIVVEASNGFCSIACLENNKVLSQRNMECSNNLSAIILQEIDNCLNDAGKSKRDLTEIIASNGPGSYHDSIALYHDVLTLKLPLKVVSSLKLQALLEFESNKLIVPLIDARRNNVFAAVYKVENKKLIEVLQEDYYSVEELNNFLKNNDEQFVYVGRDIKKLKEKLLLAENNKNEVSAANVVKIYDSLEIVDSYNMKPQYLRKTEAERELENDKNK